MNPELDNPPAGSFKADVSAMLDLLGYQPRDFVMPVCLELCSTLFRLVTLMLFLPLIFGLLGGDFGRLDRFIPLSKVFSFDNPQLMIGALVSAILLASILSALFVFVATNMTSARTESARRLLSRNLIEAFLGYGQQYYDQVRFGTLVAKVAKLPFRATQLFGFISTLLSSVLAMVIYWIAMAWIAPVLAFMVLAALFLYLFVFSRLTLRTDTLGDQVADAEDNLVAVASDVILNLPLVRIFSAEKRVQSIFDDAEAELHSARLKETRTESVIKPLREVTTMLVLLGFALMASRFTHGLDISMVSRYIVFFLIFRRAMGHFSQVLSTPRRWDNTRRRFEVLFQMLDHSDKYVVPSGDQSYEGLGNRIELRNLTFAYASKEPVLQGVSASFPVGRRSIIVGTTGSGKSTLLRLLLRQYDCPANSIFVNDTDIRQINAHQWLNRVAYAGAHPQFFNDSIRNNLTLGRDSISDQQLIEAVSRASALDFIEQRSKGFDEIIGDQGTLLSSGEQQRLAMARLYLLTPDLVLLDEATSALDSVTETRILESIDEFVEERTLIMIAHRLSNLRKDDHVIVMQDGAVAEQGLKDDLLGANGEFSKLWAIHEGSY